MDVSAPWKSCTQCNEIYDYRVVALSRGEIAQMIGTTVNFKDEYGDVRSGEVLTIDSDKFDEIKWDEVPKYWSKKTKSYRPVKEKDMETVYIEIEGRDYNDFVLLGDVLNES
jgi:hypothetical protein